MTQSNRVRLVALGALVAAVIGALSAGWGHPAWWALPALTLAVAASEIAVVHLAFGRQRWTFSLSEGAIAAAFLLSGGAWCAVAVALGVLLAQAVRHQPALKLHFNVAQFAAGASLGAALSSHLGGGVPGAVAGMGVFWLVNNLLVAGAVSIMSRRSLLGLLWASAPLAAVHSAGTSSLGLLAAWLAVHAPLGLLALVVPLVLLWLSYDEQTSRAAEVRLFAELARGQERASGRSIDLSAQVVCTAAARLFGGADVEIVLVGADGPARYSGDEDGAVRHRVDPAAFDQPWVLRALGAGGVRTGVEDARPFCSAVIGPAESPLAVIIARRPTGTAGFGRREAMLADVLVRQAQSWLSVAELSESVEEARDRAEAAADTARALGDLGAHTAPALVVLRESAARLARLAAATDGADAVGDIVDELHAVERAVASLLGAIALAADPDLATAVLPGARSAGSRAVEEWTTTGTLDGTAVSA